LGKLNAYPWGLIRKWIAFLIIASLSYACSGQPVKYLKAGRVTGVYHRVKSGQDLSHIARAYHVDVQELAEANNIQDPNRIKPDDIIFIPDAKQVIDDVMTSVKTRGPTTGIPLPKTDETKAKQAQKIDQSLAKPLVRETVIRPKTEALSGTSTIHIKPVKILDHFPAAVREEGKGIAPGYEKEPPVRPTGHAAEPVRTPALAREPGAPQPDSTRTSSGGHEFPPASGPRKEEADSLHFDRKRFIWPVRGRVVSRFGIQPNGMYYNGITIVAGEGMPVVAAAGGTVIFSGPLKDYGETIIIQHEDHYATVYTRLGQRKVKLDDRVKQADPIGHLGKGEEKRSGARLTFEIRYRSKARNPMFFLP
jgi:lipoprotein NlpD